MACFRPVLPHWGLIGLVSLFPILGSKWAARLEKRPEPTRRLLAACAGFSLVVLALTIGEYRFGWLQRDGRGGWGLVDTRTDPTLDLYGWDQVADRIKQLGLLEDSATRLSSPATGIKAPISPTPWAAISLSSATTPTIRVVSPSGAGPKNGSVAMGSWWWSVRSKRGRGIIGRWFGARRAGLGLLGRAERQAGQAYPDLSLSQQRVAYPFAIDRAERVARTAVENDRAPGRALADRTEDEQVSGASSFNSFEQGRKAVSWWRKLEKAKLPEGTHPHDSRCSWKVIPPFEENGYLAAGVHPATLDEIESRFGRESEVRRAQMESVRWLVDLAKRAGVSVSSLTGASLNDRGCAMNLRDEREVEVTRAKLCSLEARYRAVEQDPGEDADIQELTMRSLKRMINQMKEEITRFEAGRPLQASRF